MLFRSPVGQADLLAPDSFGAEVGVLGAEAAGLGERRGGQLPQGQGDEFLVDPWVVIIHDTTTYRPPVATVPSGGLRER